ncbi:kinase-like domain-containing protein, partial [Phycomyces nitens]
EEEEDEKDYKRGGYHPVSIGNRLGDGRYLIVRKLGWGHFSTVWLAKDIELDRHVALKIVKSASHYTESALEEIKILERVKAADPDSPGRDNIAQLLDHFWISGPNGKHMCMAFEVLGQSLLSVIKRYRYKGIPAPIVRRIAKQVLQGLDYLHRECGIIHTDLKPENVLVCIPDVEQLIRQDEQVMALEQKVEETKQEVETHEEKEEAPKEALESKDSPASLENTETMSKSRKKRLKKKMKKAAVKEVPVETPTRYGCALETETEFLHLDCPVIPTAALDFSNEASQDGESTQAFDQITVKIADFGNACWTKGDYTHIIQTRQYRSPEVIVGAKWTERADMWSMACLVFELLTGDYLFDPRSGKKYDKDDDHLGQMMELMRVVPKSLTTEGEYSAEFFTRKGELRRIKKLRYRRLRDVLHDSFQVEPLEADRISDFLSPMLEVDKNKRADAKKMLESPWLN